MLAVLLVLLVLLAASAVTLWLPLLNWPPSLPDVRHMLAGLALALGFLVFEVNQAHIEVRRQTFSVTLSEAPLVVGLTLVAAPVVLAARLAAWLVIVLVRRTVPVKAAFNLALIANETAIAVELYRLLGPAPPNSARAWLAVYAAVIVADLVSALWVSVAIRCIQGRFGRSEVAVFATQYAVSAVLTTGLGLLAAFALYHNPASGLLLTIVGVFVLLSFRAYAALSHRHATLGEVHDFTRRVVAASGGHELIELLLHESVRLLSADRATLWLTDPPPGVPAALRVVGQGQLQVLHDNAAEALAALDPLRRRVLETGEGRRFDRRSGGTWTKSQHIRDAVLVALYGGSGVSGLLEVDDRLGDMSTFSTEDARLLEAFATHVGVALDNERLLERSVHEATHDRLTGLPNRNLLLLRIEEQLGEGAAVVVVDVDRFQEVNDSLGHASGDAVLLAVARRLRQSAPNGSLVARLGNDEFGVVLSGVLTAVEAADCGQDLRAALFDPVWIDEVAVDVSVAVGVALAPVHGREPEALLRRAEAALRHAKVAEPSVQVWRPSLETADPRRLALVGELRRALERDELVVHYQPKVALPSGVVCGVEALVRWQHPQDGLLASDAFLPMAERTGLVVPLTSVVLRKALQQCREWLDEGRRIPVAVNLSARGLLDPHLPTLVDDMLTHFRLPAAMLTLEITESSVMNDVPRAIPVLERLAGSGVTLSVDDFGTGHSSLAYLRRLPVDEVKIDKSFVQNMATDESDAAIVETIIDLAHHLRLRVVAEGVEDERSRDLLARQGCDRAQGYLFARPLSPERLGAWLAGRGVGEERAIRLVSDVPPGSRPPEQRERPAPSSWLQP